MGGKHHLKYEGSALKSQCLHDRINLLFYFVHVDSSSI